MEAYPSSLLGDGDYSIQLPGNLIPRGFPRIPVPNDLRSEVPMNETRPLERV
jgi:hypothetical protein